MSMKVPKSCVSLSQNEQGLSPQKAKHRFGFLKYWIRISQRMNISHTNIQAILILSHALSEEKEGSLMLYPHDFQ